jgi:trk system potassium uptake protein TrkH
VIVYLLIATIWSAGRARSPHGHEASGPDRARVIGIAAGVATAMVLLIGIVTTLLAYRETGTPLACLFESVSACCNVGLSLGLTADLSLFGRVVVILAMLIGRFLPLAILLRSTAPVRQVKTRPIVEAPTLPKEDDDAPIPLE